MDCAICLSRVLHDAFLLLRPFPAESVFGIQKAKVKQNHSR